MRPGIVGAAIAKIFLTPTLLVVAVKSLRLGELGAINKHGSCLVKAERKEALVPCIIFDRLRGGAVAPGTASIYHTDPPKKVRSVLALAVIAFLMAWSQGSFQQVF